MQCDICGNPLENKEYLIKEMMFGTRDVFKYFECGNCGCLQICDVPKNISKYYNNNYSPFHYANLKSKIIKYSLSKNKILNKMFSIAFPFLNIINDISPKSKILEVGCGSGSFLFALNDMGYKNLIGIDPFINKDIKYRNVNIYKKDIFHIPEGEKFDFIIFNHSLEHIAEQVETMKKIYQLLMDDGKCIIRIPIKSDFIWEHYGTNWVQIDAPRHFYLHTLKSLKILADNSNMQIKNVVFDSYEFQFWGSERYIKNIPLFKTGCIGLPQNLYLINLNYKIFHPFMMRQYKNLAKKLNETNLGDQAIIYLEKE